MAKKRKVVKKKVEVNEDTMGDLVENMVEEQEPTEVVGEVVDAEKQKIPTINDPEWTDYVLDQLEDNELEEGFPNVSGLRRIAGVLLGEIVRSTTTMDKSPTKDDRTAVATHVIEYIKYSLMSSDPVYVSVSGTADVTEQNCPSMFFKHAASTVDTKAEAKCLRRALKLNCITAEEAKNGLPEGELNLDPNGDKEVILDQTIRAIDQIAKRSDINIVNFIKGSSVWADIEYIQQLSRDDGKIIISNLSEMQRTGNIKDEYAGYDDSWQSKFSNKGK